MPFFENIRTVALYEAKTLRRSWFFRLFSIGAIFILTFMNLGLFSPIGDEPWELVAIPAAVPLINLYLLNIGQSIVVIFLAADFLKRDKKLDTNEVLYTRPVSNFEYITGKTAGILRLFLGLDILILCIGLLMNIISKNMKVDILSYIEYLVIICVPTIVFSLGLAFMLMQVIRNQAITFMILLGYALLNMFYLWFRAGSVFDYMGFGIPVFKSGIIGFDNLDFILNQRLFFFLLGMALVMVTILLFKRLPQSRVQRMVTVVLLVCFTAGSAITFSNLRESYTGMAREKRLVLETNKSYENEKFTTINEARIELNHKGNVIEASADLGIVNNNESPVTSYLFSLNPSLVVSRVMSGSNEVPFKRVNHIIEIDPGKELGRGETDSVKIFYSGGINEQYCYPDYTDNLKENAYRIEMLNVNKRQAFLTEDYVLLTPEAHWYPVAGLNFYPSNPAKIKIDFTKYKLKVTTESGLTAVSQGSPSNENGVFSFLPKQPLTGITLAVGNYLTDTLTIDSVRYISYHYPGNDFYKKDLALLKDTLSLLVSGFMRDMETNFSTDYPFSTLSILEVPVQYYSYPKRSTQTRAELQPSMVLVPERLVTLQNAGFGKRFTRQKKRMARNNQVITDKELQLRLFNDFIRNTFISGQNFRYVNGTAWNEPTRYRLGPSFYFFKNNFYSDEYPVINAVFETHLQKIQASTENFGFTNFFGILSDNDKANLILRETSFKDLLAGNPGGDTMRTVLSLKGDYIFNLLRAKAGIDQFSNWFKKYIDENRFRSINIKDLNEDIKQKFGFELYPYLNDWFTRAEKPGFLFSNLQVREVVADERVRYQLTVIASNPEPVSGLFNLSVRTGDQASQTRGMITEGPGGRSSITIAMQGRGMEASDISKIVLLAPGETRRLAIIIDAAPRALMINTLVSKNIPGEITLPVTEIIKSKGRNNHFSEDEVLASFPADADNNGIIVDNEDPGFIRSRQNLDSPLKKLLGVSKPYGENYEDIRMFNIPVYWQPAVKSEYYGKYVLSAVYTRSGNGDRKVLWRTPVTKAGFYDIYCFVGKPGDRVTVNSDASGDSGGRGEKSPYQDMHYRIYNDEGIDEITLDYENAESGWNNLGRYYISADTAKVELTNQSAGRLVIGDAIKWVLQE